MIKLRKLAVLGGVVMMSMTMSAFAESRHRDATRSGDEGRRGRAESGQSAQSGSRATETPRSHVQRSDRGRGEATQRSEGGMYNRNDSSRSSGSANEAYRNNGSRNDSYRNNGSRNDSYRNNGSRNDSSRNDG